MAAPPIATSEKPFVISQIRAYIPIILNLDKMNYDVWREIFETHCLTFGVVDHLDGSSVATPETEKTWKERDGLVKMWIYGTITDSLVETILTPKSTARDLWLALENLFRDNKENRALQLENELRTITIGDTMVQEYCRKLKSLSDLLANIESPVTDRQLVMHCLNGLNDKFEGIHNVIRHRSPFPSFHTTRSMLLAEEERLSRQSKPAITHNDSSSAPNALFAADDSSSNSSPRHYNNNNTRGNNNNNRGRNNNHRGGGRGNRGRGCYNNNSSPQNHAYSPWSYPQQLQWPYPYFAGGHPMMTFSPPYPPVATPSSTPQQNSILGPYPPQTQPQAHIAQNAAPAAMPTLIPQALAHAFNTMSLQNPSETAWYMDSGATNHITAQSGMLSSAFNMSITPSVRVGDGSTVPVTKIGNAVLSSPSKQLLLKNVLVCPSFIKNLISVRQFVTQNKCTVEFDPFGFTVKDLLSRTTLLRCDSSGPLYSVTPHTPPRSPLALTADGSLWHRRLGHPGGSICRSLNSLDFSNKNADMITLCHACKLDKHVRLPFSSSSTIVTEPFQIIHSDIWTSPVLSNSGYKYYLRFLDHFSHYIWVYPLHRKSDTYAKYLHFPAYVRTQFSTSIKALQCDNGGEYTSRAFLDHLASAGTAIRFSCPHTSQQNGRAERMLRTINNLVRTFLIQANMPITFWVESLLTAVHTLNLLPSSSINNLIPFTRLFKLPVSYSHLRVFGCLCYPNSLSTSPHKLAPRSMACVFLGYPSTHRGYRCLNIATRKIIISRHVTFVEDVFPFSVLPISPSLPAFSPLPPPIIPPPALTPPTAGNTLPPTTQNNHPMVTRSKTGITKPRVPMCLHTDTVFLFLMCRLQRILTGMIPWMRNMMLILNVVRGYLYQGLHRELIFFVLCGYFVISLMQMER